MPNELGHQAQGQRELAEHIVSQTRGTLPLPRFCWNKVWMPFARIIYYHCELKDLTFRSISINIFLKIPNFSSRPSLRRGQGQQTKTRPSILLRDMVGWVVGRVDGEVGPHGQRCMGSKGKAAKQGIKAICQRLELEKRFEKKCWWKLFPLYWEA